MIQRISWFRLQNPIRVIVNPAAGNGGASASGRRLVGHLRARGAGFEVLETKGRDHAGELAAEFLADNEHGVIVAVGGDGTAHEVAQAFGAFPGRGSLCFVSAGGGNDAARTFGLPRGTRQAAELALTGAVRSFDLGLLEGEFFVNGVGVGLDGETAERSKEFKRLRGLPAYLAAALLTIARYRHPVFRLEGAGEVWEGKGLLCAVGNGPSCGGGFLLTPSARPDDGLLDACLLGEFTRLETLANLPRALYGGHRNHPKAHFYRAESFTLFADRPVLAHADGEVRRLEFPVRFSVARNAIRVRVPWHRP
jgi:diacylglycerol kinase (ATP)